ncbi:reverse transcriptase domain-containing protein [Tanacetum coccineum]|uniref:Reverse transcriptase domain-containing protein n=1 Tax=Tanacetum coccineum TaxID=301880 RepID=A0ABQ4ZMY9_9ASTR
MHTHASNSEFVEPLPEPERTLNRRLRRRNKRVPFEQRNHLPQNSRVVYPPILDINYFRHLLVTLQTLNPMDDKPMWAAVCVVSPTPGSVITIPETANEFAIKGSSNSDIDKIMARMDAMTMKMDAQYKYFQLTDKQSGRPSGSLPSNTDPNPKAENMLIEVGKFTFPADFIILEMEEDSKVPLILGRPFLHTTDAVIQVKQKQLNLRVRTERMIFHIDSAMKHSYSNEDTCFSIDVINKILEEDFDALLDEGSEILHSIEGTILEEKLLAEFAEFVAMTADENFKSDTEEPPFEKITFNTNYKIKTSLEEPPTDLVLKPLLDNLEYVFLEEPSFLPVIISS